MRITKKIENFLFLRAFILFFIAGGFFSVAPPVWAATLDISPSSGIHTVGENFSVSVIVSSPDQAINAVDTVVSFPADKLQATSVSKDGSVINLWAEEPVFSNSVGQVSMSGVVLSPGFIGPSGRVLKINFKVKTPGNAAVVFSSGSVLANDGRGTNILTSLNSGQFNLHSREVKEATTIPSPPSIPKSEVVASPDPKEMIPIVSSATHPDPNRWYNNNDPLFNWNLPERVTGLRIVLSHDPTEIPHVKYAPILSIGEKNLTDGTWYLHIRFEDRKGLGETTHFRFQIDTEPPAPATIIFSDGNTSSNSRPKIIIRGSDSLSGIGGYRIKIGNGNFVEAVPESGTDTYLCFAIPKPGNQRDHGRGIR